jgi:hypothetical protein
MRIAEVAAVMVSLLSLSCFAGDAGGPAAEAAANHIERRILEVHDAMVAAMVAGTSSAEFMTSEWRGVNLNGTPMSAAGFEGEERVMVYDRIELRDREVRIYGDVAALRWHADFHVQVNGRPGFAEMRLLDVYVLRDGRWLNDLTQVTPVYVGDPSEGESPP